ncbi:MAG: ATP-dependent helicase RecG [Petroclostridium sp.]|uniref:RNA-binding domain-containing protein n=1 Tax=Petroclostridium xylanilyticum TaxID=1792311 RepID=UPI000B98C8D9|nr:RNA-binding domain-containing protein [Petroclostridium xylanilyticum]MBZ4645034.1 putative transcriptional regulator [Clostridia bacterium]MDK2810312.1 ATP-dependent helicase RecG [Petroclostridium sp.]
MDVQKLKNLLQQEEGPKLDFKAKLYISTESEKKELTKDVIAMANSPGGRGYILFGIEDKTKEVLGVDPTQFSEEQIQQIIYNRCDPPVPICVDLLEYQGKQIAVLTVYKSNQKPHQMLQNGAFYVRRGSTTDTARREEIANMLQENGLFSYERVILRNACIEQLDSELIKQHFPFDLLLLEGLGIIGNDTDSGQYHPTIGGMLLFGHNPYIFLPHVYIKVLYNNNTKLFTGNILSMLDNVESFLASICSDANYPLEAVNEALANAVVHRDYLDISNGIIMKISSKYIEIINPGAMVSGNRIYKVYNQNHPKRRNPWLYQRLLMVDKKSRFLKYGLGINRIKEYFKNIGNVKFVNLGSQNLFKAILPGFEISSIPSNDV